MLNKNYKKIDIQDIKKRKTYAIPEMKDIHFYPAKLNTKMDATYSNNLYTSISDYHDTLNKDYFFTFNEETKEDILPEVPPVNFISDGAFNKEIKITLEYKKFQEIYTKYLDISPTIDIGDEQYPNPNYPFDLKKVNYFCSDWNAINPHLKYSYWFVTNIQLFFDQNTKEIRNIDFYLTLDCYSEFYNNIFFYAGTLNVKRMHNPRWIEDNIYNTGYYIPDFASQRFIRNCDDYCIHFNDKIQRTQTVPLISSRHWDVQSETPINNKFLKWDSDNWDAKVAEKKAIVFLVCMRINQFEAANGKDPENKENLYSYYQGEITDIGGYSEPLRYFAYITSDPNGIPIQDELRKIVNLINVDGVVTDESVQPKKQQYRIVSSIFTENIFDDNSFTEISDNNIVSGTLYKMINGKLDYYANKDRKEYFYFIEPNEKIYTNDDSNNKILDTSKQQPYLWPKMFKTRDDIIGVETITESNYDVEPHLFTNQHFNTSIAIFNKNPITFDISTLLINNNTAFDSAEVYQKLGGHNFSYKLMLREGLVSSNMLDIKYFLLDQDTSVAYKRDNNLLTISVVGTYIWPYYDNTWNEFIHNNQNQRQTALENIQQQYKTQKTSAWLGFGGGLLGGGTSGTAAGINVAREAQATKGASGTAGILGGIAGIVGAGISGALGMVGHLNELNTQKEIALRTINSQYEDAKNQPGNYNVGSALTTQADMLFGMHLNDDIDVRNYNFLWTPKITFMQLKDYDCRTIAEYLNKMGYPQNQFIHIEQSLNEIAYRQYWNRWQFTNADEFFKKDNIPPIYWVDIAKALMNIDGACFFNADVISWDEIYDWDIHNIEKIFDNDLMVLEGKIYG